MLQGGREREGEINHSMGMRVGRLASVLAIGLKNNFHCLYVSYTCRLAILPMVYTPTQIPTYRTVDYSYHARVGGMI